MLGPAQCIDTSDSAVLLCCRNFITIRGVVIQPTCNHATFNVFMFFIFKSERIKSRLDISRLSQIPPTPYDDPRHKSHVYNTILVTVTAPKLAEACPRLPTLLLPAPPALLLFLPCHYLCLFVPSPTSALLNRRQRCDGKRALIFPVIVLYCTATHTMPVFYASDAFFVAPCP